MTTIKNIASGVLTFAYFRLETAVAAPGPMEQAEAGSRRLPRLAFDRLVGELVVPAVAAAVLVAFLAGLARPI